MKITRYILLFLLLFTCMENIIAQDFSIMSGVNFTKRRYHNTVLPNLDDDPKFLYVTGYNLGGYVDLPLNSIYDLRTGVMIQSQGYQYDNLFLHFAAGSSEPTVYTIRQKFQYQYLGIPVDFKYNLSLNRKHELYVSAGVYAGYSIYGRSTEINKVVFNTDGLAVEMKTGSMNMKKSPLPRFDYGLRFGIGVNIKRFIFEFNSIIGLRTYWKESSSEYDNKLKTPYRGVMLSVGYQLNE